MGLPSCDTAPMTLPRDFWRWTALTLLWIWFSISAWVVVVQVFVVVWDSPGQWRMPGVSKVTVKLVGTDEEGKISGYVWADREGKEVQLRLFREEAVNLAVDDEIWVLRNYRKDGHRPNEFLLGPWRLLGEYPEPLMFMSAWAIYLLRRRQRAEAKAIAEAPNPNRKVWKDEFHSRAERFTKKDDSAP